FARFSLQLLSLGAPADLIEKTNQALVDETKHAKLCFGLASAYRGRAVGPEPLDIGGVMRDTSLKSIIKAAIFEGCSGETAAALEASEAAAHCEDPAVRAILEQIAADESRHAELAWRFMRWISETHPEMCDFIGSQFEELLGAASLSSDAAPGPLACYGVLAEERRVAVRRAALRDVVAPCASELLARATQRHSSSDIAASAQVDLQA